MSQILKLTYMPDGTVVNETNHDPAKPRVTGYERYWIGCDLGQSNDFTAIVAIKDTCLPTVIDKRIQLGQRERTIVFADKVRGVSYVDIVDYLIRLKNAKPFAGRSQLVIDGTGLGRPVSDLLHDQNMPHVPITMVAGQSWKRSGRYVNAGKTLIIENGAVLFASGELKFAHDLQMREEIEQDLASFSLTTTAAGNQIISQPRSASGHGDTAIALLIAAFASQYLDGNRMSVGQLDNYY